MLPWFGKVSAMGSLVTGSLVKKQDRAGCVQKYYDIEGIEQALYEWDDAMMRNRVREWRLDCCRRRRVRIRGSRGSGCLRGRY